MLSHRGLVSCVLEVATQIVKVRRKLGFVDRQYFSKFVFGKLLDA
jgi:hypothetical protein